MEYTLPKTVSVGGREYSIRSDYRAILDICEALTDPELTNEEKAEVLTLPIFRWRTGRKLRSSVSGLSTAERMNVISGRHRS